MRRFILSLLLCGLSATAAMSGPKQQSLLGSWCLSSENLIITFFKGDSVQVNSPSEDGVNGRGTFTKADSMFIATIRNEQFKIVMGYQYDWKNDTTITARTLFLTINGDTTDVSKERLTMQRCSPKPKASKPKGAAR
jgi:hypothetical protein